MNILKTASVLSKEKTNRIFLALTKSLLPKEYAEYAGMPMYVVESALIVPIKKDLYNDETKEWFAPLVEKENGFEFVGAIYDSLDKAILSIACVSTAA